MLFKKDESALKAQCREKTGDGLRPGRTVYQERLGGAFEQGFEEWLGLKNRRNWRWKVFGEDELAMPAERTRMNGGRRQCSGGHSCGSSGWEERIQQVRQVTA